MASANDFLAKLTLHIPNRYQNIRRYAGFYSSNIQREVRAAKQEDLSLDIEAKQPVKPKWAKLIAMIFGSIPVICPHCKLTMDLKEFVLDEKLILRDFSYIARAPPKRQFEKYEPNENETSYSLFSENKKENISQEQEWDESYYNQDLSW